MQDALSSGRIAGGKENPIRNSLAHQKLKLNLAAQGLKAGDARGNDALVGGADGSYRCGTLRGMCRGQAPLLGPSVFTVVSSAEAHENATAAEDEMKPQVPSAANIEAQPRLHGDPLESCA
jgi:hypothetical protein